MTETQDPERLLFDGKCSASGQEKPLTIVLAQISHSKDGDQDDAPWVASTTELLPDLPCSALYTTKQSLQAVLIIAPNFVW